MDCGYGQILSIPFPVMLGLIRNQREAKQLLEVSECSIQLDILTNHLTSWLDHREVLRAYLSQFLGSADSKLLALVPAMGYTLHTIEKSLPSLEKMLQMLMNKLVLLKGQVESTAEVNAALAGELRGLDARVAAEKRALCRIEEETASRLCQILSGRGDPRCNKHGEPFVSMSRTCAEILKESNISLDLCCYSPLNSKSFKRCEQFTANKNASREDNSSQSTQTPEKLPLRETAKIPPSEKKASPAGHHEKAKGRSDKVMNEQSATLALGTALSSPRSVQKEHVNPIVVHSVGGESTARAFHHKRTGGGGGVGLGDCEMVALSNEECTGRPEAELSGNHFKLSTPATVSFLGSTPSFEGSSGTRTGSGKSDKHKETISSFSKVSPISPIALQSQCVLPGSQAMVSRSIANSKKKKQNQVGGLMVGESCEDQEYEKMLQTKHQVSVAPSIMENASYADDQSDSVLPGIGSTPLAVRKAHEAHGSCGNHSAHRGFSEPKFIHDGKKRDAISTEPLLAAATKKKKKANLHLLTQTSHLSAPQQMYYGNDAATSGDADDDNDEKDGIHS